MKFDFCIGNPPFQGENEDSTRKPPVYYIFMDAAFLVADKVELITPARFLFDAGQTPKAWNKKMLGDKHFKPLHYESDGTKVFPNTDIKGGVVISYRDLSGDFGPIGTFTPYDELNKILNKVINACDKQGYMDDIISSRGCYRLSEGFFSDYPTASSKVGTGTGNMIVSNIFDKIPEAFSKEKPQSKDSVRILGRANNKREYRYIYRKYILKNEFIDSYNVLLPEANNNGKFGEILATPTIACKGEGATDTFISIGCFISKKEAQNAIIYLKTKFLRTLLGVKKATQHNPKAVWKYVPLQNFSNESDIDWSKSVVNIDKQLYKKYKLSKEEINFIETHVKEMA